MRNDNKDDSSSTGILPTYSRFYYIFDEMKLCNSRCIIDYKYLKEVGGFALAKANHLDKVLQPGPPTLEFKNFEAKSGN